MKQQFKQNHEALMAGLRAFRRNHLFITPGEAKALAAATADTVREIEHTHLAHLRQDAIEAEQRARNLFTELQTIKVDVHNVRQAIEIKLTLDRRSLACVDVTLAADVLAKRCEYLFREQLNKRLGYRAIDTKQPA